MSETRVFDRKKYRTQKEFWDAFDRLCALTPSKEETCKRIRENQELFLEYQQKCLNQYDPTLQQAIEHAGDIIRELAKCGYAKYGCDLKYVGEKIMRLEKRIEDLSERGGK